MSENRDLLHAWKTARGSLRLYREGDDTGDLTLFLVPEGGTLEECVAIDMSPAIATSVGRMLVRKTVGK